VAHPAEFLQRINNGLTLSSWDQLDAAAGGAPFSKMVRDTTDLIEKRLSNMGWSEERLQTRQRGMYTIEGMKMLAAQLDLLMKETGQQ
jgi:hypothetical protein